MKVQSTLMKFQKFIQEHAVCMQSNTKYIKSNLFGKNFLVLEFDNSSHVGGQKVTRS
jgi:hypothetical protein